MSARDVNHDADLAMHYSKEAPFLVYIFGT